MTTKVLILHRVADYAAWKQVFDDAAALRFAGGERDFHVLRDDVDPDLVVHYSTWTSAAAARAFFESDELIALRERAGVEAPEFRYLEMAEAGLLTGT
ncbi:MAG: antibiotic biosynthesis monooxygenase [Marmoricola sp.]|nr:antibiotic biosynthesis monooxygenase [Marmoricola sp.]